MSEASRSTIMKNVSTHNEKLKNTLCNGKYKHPNHVISKNN